MTMMMMMMMMLKDMMRRHADDIADAVDMWFLSRLSRVARTGQKIHSSFLTH
jgi:hypothetical protein